MHELNKKELDGLLKFNQTSIALFLYTPLCGTCKLASEMVEIVSETLPQIDIYRININLIPDAAQKWQVTSVPCLMILHGDRVVKKVYAMNSVTDLYELLRSSV